MGSQELGSGFIRTCPLGVQSCFYVTGTYKNIGKKVKSSRKKTIQKEAPVSRAI
jgi:hypothetical protein